MKHSFLIFISCFICSVSFGQQECKISSSTVKNVLIELNGIRYHLDSTETSVKINYPAFDTLVFYAPLSDSTSKIICNFKPDSSYSIVYACCGSLDIVQSHRLDQDSLQYWYSNYDEDHGKIQLQLMDAPHVSLKLAKNTDNAIYAWCEDAACFTRFKVLSEEQWKYGVPEKCFYWTNISSFLFFESDEDYSKLLIENDEYEGIPDYGNIKILTHIRFRMFDPERFIITYDPLEKQAAISYEN